MYTGGMVSTNGYIIELDDAVIVIDAPKGITQHLKDKELKATHLLITHQHFDHIEDALEVQQMCGAKTYAMEVYNEDLSLTKTARSWGMAVDDLFFEVTDTVAEGDTISIASLNFKVLHVPGHSPESLCFYLEDHGLIFVGDTLMPGGMGRHDFEYGDGVLLKKGIREKILSLPTETVSLSGHGPHTTVGEELSSNPHFAS